MWTLLASRVDRVLFYLSLTDSRLTETMSIDVFLKIPFLLIFMKSAQICMNPPSPPPSPSEHARMKSTNLEVLMHRSAALYLVAFWIIVSTVDLLVTAVIRIPELAPLRPLTQTLLSYNEKGTYPRIKCSPFFLLGCLLAIFGSRLRWLAYRELGHLYTFEMSIKKDHRLVRSGVYGWVRHPGYTGVAFFVVGTALCHGSKGSWLRESGIMYNPIGLAMVVPPLSLFFTIAFGLMRRMRKEDEAMRELFGTEWDDWAGKVKFKLFPYIY